MTKALSKQIDARTGVLLGAHMIGLEVTELIQGYAIARTLETTEAELMQTIFPHPTLSKPCMNRFLTLTAKPSISDVIKGKPWMVTTPELNDLARPVEAEGADRHPEKGSQ